MPQESIFKVEFDYAYRDPRYSRNLRHQNHLKYLFDLILFKVITKTYRFYLKVDASILWSISLINNISVHGKRGGDLKWQKKGLCDIINGQYLSLINSFPFKQSDVLFNIRGKNTDRIMMMDFLSQNRR